MSSAEQKVDNKPADMKAGEKELTRGDKKADAKSVAALTEVWEKGNAISNPNDSRAAANDPKQPLLGNAKQRSYCLIM